MRYCRDRPARCVRTVLVGTEIELLLVVASLSHVLPSSSIAYDKHVEPPLTVVSRQNRFPGQIGSFATDVEVKVFIKMVLKSCK